MIPVFNEARTVVEVIDRVRATGMPVELVVVDDGSTDGTQDVLRKHQDRIDRLILLDRNRGKGAALKAGFAVVTGDIVVIQDADLEYDPEDYAELMKPIAKAGSPQTEGLGATRPSIPNVAATSCLDE